MFMFIFIMSASEAARLDSRMQRHLQRDTQVDRGELEHMIKLMEQGEKGDPFPSSDISTMLQKAREMGFFQTPGNFKSRGVDFIPHFRTDADVIKSYTESTIASYFNHLYALQVLLLILTDKHYKHLLINNLEEISLYYQINFVLALRRGLIQQLH